MNKSTSNFIKHLRESKGMSQEQVATAIGKSRPAYNALELGKQPIDIEEAKKLASLFGIGVDSLLFGRIPDYMKYKQMILSYLRANISTDGKVPKTKLAKLLYLADFAWFYENLQSMSGMPYRKITYGPVPDGFFRALDELQEEGKIKIEKKESDEKTSFLVSEVASNKNEKLSTISKEEAILIKKIALKWKDKKTSEIVNFTHNQLPYSIAREDELIPYEMITQEDPNSVY
jgi:transcriptional regulator with XRE-family HTH domain